MLAEQTGGKPKDQEAAVQGVAVLVAEACCQDLSTGINKTQTSGKKKKEFTWLLMLKITAYY